MHHVPVKVVDGVPIVSLLMSHQKRLTNAAELLEAITTLDCPEKDECREVARWLRRYATTRKRLATTKYLPGQLKLPLTTGDDKGEEDTEETA
jgi:hypothetical protein